MIVLALDSTAADCSACLMQDETVLAHLSERIGRGHAERLAPMVADLFGTANLSPDQVHRVAVCSGPGSFTGLRVALSFAKGFGLPRRLPVLGFDALHIRAAQEQGRCTIFRDVKRGQVFAARYENGHPLTEPVPMTLEEAETLAGDGPFIEAMSAHMPTLALIASRADPAAYPADPLYARAPDAKLPGGITPQFP